MKEKELKKELHLHIGGRIIKSAIAVWVCYMIYFLRGKQGLPFDSAVAAMLCMQTYTENSKTAAINRIIGTMIGAFYGSLILAAKFMLFKDLENNAWYYTLLSVVIIPIIQTTVRLKKPQVAYFSCVVFLSIAANHILDEQPFMYVLNRVIDTLIGIMVSLGINTIKMPTKKQKDILFISGIDNTLLTPDDAITPYSKIELNRLIDAGANFTVATERTPASVMEALRDIHFKMPIIVMNGAALYDMKEHRYMHTFPLKYDRVKAILEILDREKVGYFLNAVIQDVLLIYFTSVTNSTMEEIHLKLRKSPYRNYINAPLPEGQDVLYIYIVEPTAIIEHLARVLEKEPFIKDIKIHIREEKGHEGYSYMKIYSPQASRENMMDYLQAQSGFKKRITFSSIEGRSDVLIQAEDGNAVVKTMKREYERYIWEQTS